jgi:metallo-beta-lactamase family protein
MRISFHGAAREVTGSCHLVDTGDARLLLDCGLIQGGQERHERNREPFPFDAASLTRVILSHAHIDHSGRLALLVKAGYRGPILTTAPTARLLDILLPDSGRIQEEDANWKIKRLKKQGQDASWVTPLYTEEEAIAVLARIETVEFNQPHDLDGAGTVTFVPAGHILGAAIVDLRLGTGASQRRLVFSGDLGVHDARLLAPPEAVPSPDYLIMESTYGDRSRTDEGDRTESLFSIIDRTIRRRGKVIIPAFAVGRTQEILARLNDLVENGRLRDLRVFVDSPMAVAATKAFVLHPEAYSDQTQAMIDAGDAPLAFNGLTLITSVEDSIALNHSTDPAVIISASGMCTAGRIKHHLKFNLSDSKNTVLFVGYQAQGSLGRVIQSGTSPVRIFGDWYPVNARIETLEGFSAHADRDELLEWFGSLGRPPKRTFVVHGEEEASLSFAQVLEHRFGANVTVPQRGQTVDLA